MTLTALIPRGSRAAFAERLGISIGYLNQLCQARRPLTKDLAFRLADALHGLGHDVSLEELLGTELPVWLRLRRDDPVLSPVELVDRELRRRPPGALVPPREAPAAATG